METNNFYHLLILDASGSMDIIRRTALNGCNENIQHILSLQQKGGDKEQHFVSLVSFNSSIKTHYIYDCLPIEEAKTLQESDYVPNDCTPLYDAIGFSCQKLQSQLNPQNQNFVLVTIITDGQENDSTEFSANQIKMFVEEYKHKGWTFAFIGANQDEVMEAGKLGIRNTMHFEQDAEGTTAMFSALRRAQGVFCEAAVADAIPDGELFNL